MVESGSSWRMPLLWRLKPYNANTPILSDMNFNDFHIHYVDYQDTIPVAMWE